MASDQDAKIVLITGASSGFGYDIATLLSEKGYRVFGTSRDPKKAKNAKFEMLKLDVTSDSSVKSFFSNLKKKTSRIDILVNNAGYVSSGAIEENTLPDARSQFETNFFGTVRMVNYILPIMRRQGGGQIINISSMADTIIAPFQGFYAPSKAAVTSYSEALRLEVKSFGIKVSIVEPGIFKTNLFNISKKASQSIGAYSKIEKRSIDRLNEDIELGGDPKKVATTVLKIIESKNPRLHYPVGKERVVLFLKKMLPESAYEKGLRRHFELDKQD